MNYYLFRTEGNHIRLEKARTVFEACKLAYGCVYGPNSGVQYKNLGGRNPKYLSQKKKQVLYNEPNWIEMPGK